MKKDYTKPEISQIIMELTDDVMTSTYAEGNAGHDGSGELLPDFT